MNEQQLTGILTKIREQSPRKYFGEMELDGYKISTSKCTDVTRDVIYMKYYNAAFSFRERPWYILGNFFYGTIVACVDKDIEYLITPTFTEEVGV